ncbi:hypothetical protein, partial [Cutibacterium avidum]|uniref:hypothetical protein n=1 Tax=Cutibacterium avidum TaxID=33010 RepID=UPI001E476D3C
MKQRLPGAIGAGRPDDVIAPVHATCALDVQLRRLCPAQVRDSGATDGLTSATAPTGRTTEAQLLTNGAGREGSRGAGARQWR